MDIDELTLGQIKEIKALLGSEVSNPISSPSGINCFIGRKVIIRCYSAGNWYGVLKQKDGNEVILLNARRLWRWFTKKSISLSAVAVHGVKASNCKFAPAVEEVWLEAIEIIPCTDAAIKTIEGVKDAETE